MPYIAKPLTERFHAKVMPEPNSGCWLWTGKCNHGGYGQLTMMPYESGRGKKQTVSAHRLAYEFVRGPIPADMQVLHKCDVPSCVNPDHLFLGTDQDNMTDKCRKGRHRSGHGESHGSAKLTEAIVKSIRADERTHEEIARELGISQAHVTNVKRGKRWRHV